jgi:hypothetical protein
MTDRCHPIQNVSNILQRKTDNSDLIDRRGQFEKRTAPSPDFQTVALLEADLRTHDGFVGPSPVIKMVQSNDWFERITTIALLLTVQRTAESPICNIRYPQ